MTRTTHLLSEAETGDELTVTDTEDDGALEKGDTIEVTGVREVSTLPDGTAPMHLYVTEAKLSPERNKLGGLAQLKDGDADDEVVIPCCTGGERVTVELN